MYKKIMSAIISLAMIITVMSMPILAAEGNIVSIRVPTSTSNSSQSARNMYIPKEEHDLTSKDYLGDFDDVAYKIYSSFWFRCSANNDLYMKIRPNRPCTVILYDRDDSSIEVTYSVSAKEDSHIRFYNLDSSHRYYFGFHNDADYASVNTMNGTFTVSHTNTNK